MDARSMIAVLRVRDSFHARVVMARLGSEGIVCQLRGADGPYPMGLVEVLVLAEELEAAQELLLADEVESAFPDEDEEPGNEPRSAPPRWAVAAAVAVLLVYLLAYALSAR